MLRFLHYLLTAVPTAFISALLFFPTAGFSQYYPGCFMVTSSGQVVNLNNLCPTQAQLQSIRKMQVCQGPFDSDGFPVVLLSELQRLKVAITAAQKKNLELADNPEVQFEITALLNRTPLPQGTLNLIQERKRLYEEFAKKAEGSEESYLAYQKLKIILDELNDDECLSHLSDSLVHKFNQNIFFLVK